MEWRQHASQEDATENSKNRAQADSNGNGPRSFPPPADLTQKYIHAK